MARLTAEVERLSAELKASHLQIGELESRIDVDPLTGTLNRRGFERALARSLAYVKRYQATAAQVYLDLDQFKPVNDRHGHAAGDAVLQAISAALLREVRASDIVARIGGDEFAVLLWNMTEADALGKAAALEQAVYATPGAFPPWWSARRQELPLWVRSIGLRRCSRAPMPRCMPARCNERTSQPPVRRRLERNRFRLNGLEL